MKSKLVSLILSLALLLGAALPCLAEPSFSGSAQLIYDAIRWNLNLPKQSMLVHAEEYLIKLSKDVTLNALLMEVTLSEELEAMYGMGAKIIVIDLDTGEIIDYKNFDGNVVWPDGEITSKYDALHLLYNCYWSYLEGWNATIMADHEFITPIAGEDVAAINAALAEAFIR